MDYNNSKFKEVRDFLVQNLVRENSIYWGNREMRWLDHVANAWMNDLSNSKWRYELIQEFISLHQGAKILDMAGGCGTFVFYGLINGYDVYGVEPEAWKNEFNKMKVKLYDYPKNWISHFTKAFGEHLPFLDEYFEVVSTYQTLEHVVDVEACLKELFRVVKKGGYVFLQFPDYTSTFEGHYRLPWMPLFYKPLARAYLKIRGRPTTGLKNINYVTKRNVMSTICKMYHMELEVIDLDKVFFHRRTKGIIAALKIGRLNLPGKALAVILNLGYAYLYTPMKRLFRSEKRVSIIVRRPY